MSTAEVVVIVPGNDEKFRGQVCITSPTRPHPAHCWARAALHCLSFKDVPYFVQMESATACWHMAEAAKMIPRPPQRASGFGWGKGWPGKR